VKVAIIIGPDVVAIDVIGPQTALLSADMYVPEGSGFDVDTVAETRNRIDSGGIFLEPTRTFADVPNPDVLIVPQQKHLPSTIEYIKSASRSADLTMSICTGAFLAAEAGLFDGGRATTHHSAYDRFARTFPKVTLVRGVRYVEDPAVSSSGGEMCGIDLALRAIERYFGSNVAANVAYSMEYRRTPRPRSLSDV
jgi:transcriptional regulator GlxA family with amidase domain